MIQKIEIALATYNRPEFVKKWFELHMTSIEKLGFIVSVYDSSTNLETRKIVEQARLHSKNIIRYFCIEPTMRVDEKVLYSITNSTCKYVWPLGDSNYYDLINLKEKVIPYINQNYDVACIFGKTKLNNDDKTYTDAVEFFKDCFWHATWLGGMVFKKELFDFKYKDEEFNAYMKKYNRNDGFSYLGVFYDIIANKSNLRISFNVIKTEPIFKNKTPGWLKRYFEVWGDNLCFFVDNLDPKYNQVKDEVLRTTWKILKLDGVKWCCRARLAGGLNKEIFERYDSSGLIDRVSSHKQKIRLCATSNICIVTAIYAAYSMLSRIKHFLKKFFKGERV